MRHIILSILAVSLLISCTSETKTSKKQYYLNKKYIEIIEFEDTNIFRYQLIDSIKTKLEQKDLVYFTNSKDSFKIARNDSLVYKKIDLNTEDSIDVYDSKYWTIKLKDKQQYWVHFFKLTDTLENGNLYHFDAYNNYYYLPENKDTTSYYSGGYSDSRDYKLFNKFRLKDIGPFGGELSLFSKISDNSINIIPVTSIQKDNIVRTFVLEKYDSYINKSFIGNWTLNSESLCEYFDMYIGNNLKISENNITFSKDSETLSEVTYRLGLDSKYIFVTQENSSFGYNTINEIKIISVSDEYLKLRLRYNRGFCEDIDTLVYKRINQ